MNPLIQLYLKDINELSSDPRAMYNLGYYYKIIKDYKNMKKYFLMAIDKGCAKAMHDFGVYYYEIKDYENMKKYLLMAIDKGDADAMVYLSSYYYKEMKDYENMKKYLLMAIDNSHSKAMNIFGIYYHEIKDYDNMKKYYLMAIDKGDLDALNLLAEYYWQNNDKESSKLILDGNYKMTKDYKRIFQQKCFRCLDKYIEPSKSIDCIHKDICNECIINITACPKCGTKYG